MKIHHRNGSYDVRFLPFAEAMGSLPPDSFILTDENVHRAWRQVFSERPTLVLEPGEGSKRLESYGRALGWLATQRASRKSTLVAAGGGVVGDLGGFVAASYMRGIQLIQIPTTLLAQVDSSVGGKVGIDLPEGKNLVGAFWPPTEVRVSADSLKTLDERQFRNGMAEVWKYGFIMDADLVGKLSADVPQSGEMDMDPVVKRCIELKAYVVQEDEFETKGLRAILNFGHTVGHAIEQVTCYRGPLHGEAIAIGMVAEAKLGERLGVTEPGTATIVRHALASQGLPIWHDSLRQPDALVEAMRRDKKAVAGQLAFSLLTKVGHSKLVERIEEAEVRLALAEQ